MAHKFPEYKQLDLPTLNKEMQEVWEKENCFQASLENRKNAPRYVFFEGPPSANGKPGIHHVISRSIKDIVCRYKTLSGYLVERKAGWDTHGLPVELSVEKTLGITKEDIGEKISVEEYNATCRKEVMKYTGMWEELTRTMGYWINMDDPYITYDNRYIESLWYLLNNMFDKGLLYKGYTVQPYSPAAGTGLSTHELNQPGCYRDVKDTTCTAMFKLIRETKSEWLFEKCTSNVFFLAWTTTPWTLPSNTALAVGHGIEYQLIQSFNPYTGAPASIIVCSDRLAEYFDSEMQNADFDSYKEGDKKIPWKSLARFKGNQLQDLSYEQLIPWVNPGKNAFRIIPGDYVTTEDGTGVVHIAPTFGADDDRVAKAKGIPPLILIDKAGNRMPMVDKKGRFARLEDLDPEFVKKQVNETVYADFEGRFVKNEYAPETENKAANIDVDIAVMLKKQGLAFKIEKHVHNYPHCWRTDKPILYYPMDSWFIRTTALKKRMLELNKSINWKPKFTGEGRFGNWLENLVDWNLSRSRYWGTPLPIWCTKDGKEQKCIGSVPSLFEEIQKAIAAGYMDENPIKDFTPGDKSKDNYEKIDLHRPYVDNIILVSDSGEKMFREPDLIDVWFDSGAMPYAQWHYPFENKKNFNNLFPADFIAEGVDQTRGWFFTLHAIATMASDSVAFRNIISNGLVLDKHGNKMSKRLGNAADPFEIMHKYGADALRWYMMTNAQPWDNLKFDKKGVEEIQRKFFGTLHNTYNFFALYANIDGFRFEETLIPVNQRSELDRWILSALHSLIDTVKTSYDEYEPTRAGRAIQHFVTDLLSNWYVRLGRKRYWGGAYDSDKIAAYQTLYTCLETISILMSPISPFYADTLFRNLNNTCGSHAFTSVHLADFPTHEERMIDSDLEERMQMAQDISSMILGLRRKVNIKVRQPLRKIMIPVLNEKMQSQISGVSDIIRTETNVKEIEYLNDASSVLVKKIKPNFKALGPKYGKMMKDLAPAIQKIDQTAIAEFEKNGTYRLHIGDQNVELDISDVEIISEDIPGWLVTNHGNLTVALDIEISPELKREGIARELINRIQNLRKESGFEVTDKIHINIEDTPEMADTIAVFGDYICEQTLGLSINLTNNLEQNQAKLVDMDNSNILLQVEKAD